MACRMVATAVTLNDLEGNPPLPAPPFSFLSFFPYFPLSFPSPPFPLPLEVDPLNTAKGSGSAVSSRRVWGGAPAEIVFFCLVHFRLKI